MKLTLTAPATFTVLASDTEAAAGAPIERRTVAGFAVPWNVDANASTGPVRFLEGSIPVDGPAPKLIRDHDMSAPIGLVTSRVSTPAGIEFRAKISATPAGDEALTLAADGVLDSVSVGVTVGAHSWDGDTLVVESAQWDELSLVPWGAFAAAKVTQVAATPADASAQPTTPTEEATVPDSVPEVEATIPANTLTIVPASRPLASFTAADYVSAIVCGRHDAPVVRAVAAENVIADIPGIVPEPLVGSIFDTLNARRPLVASFGVQAMPREGETFYRRKVSQHTDVTVQATEFTELASQALNVDRVQVDKKTLGGYVDLSLQSISWSDTSAVSLILSDLARVYAKATETEACTALETGATVTDTIADWTDGDEILDAIYAASATIDAAIDELPTTIWVAPDRWATLGQAKAANGERLFPSLGPSNAAGQMNAGSFVANPAGLRLVVSNKLTTGTMIIGHPMGLELFEQSYGALRVDQPATASVRLALVGFWAEALMEVGAFVKLIDAGA